MEFKSNMVEVNDGLVSINGVIIDDVTVISVLNDTVYVKRNYDILCEVLIKRISVFILEERNDDGYCSSMTSYNKSSKADESDFISILKENIELYE